MNDKIIVRKIEKKDAKQVYNLVKSTGILDLNSQYLYLLQTTYFQDSCCVAVIDDKIIGFISAFIKPTQLDTLFIWQVAVDENFRGKNIAARMIAFIISISQYSVNYIETTISPSNKSSQRLFSKLSIALNCEIKTEVLFDTDDFIDAEHEEEILYKIGPLHKHKER